MGTPQRPELVTLFAGIMYEAQFEIGPALERLKTRFGPAECSYGPVDFSWTDYYASEMGAGLEKIYVCFGNLIDREKLSEIKHWTNNLEAEYAIGGRRRINIDPGYLARDKLVLASTKDFYHRLYLGGGIYGEVTLHFRQGVFRHFSWTYPDYKEENLQTFLIKARASMASLVGKIRKE